jgi:hypothetical protein
MLCVSMTDMQVAAYACELNCFSVSTHIYLHYKNRSFICMNFISQVVEKATYSFLI